MAEFNSAREKNCSFRRAAVIHADTFLTVPSALLQEYEITVSAFWCGWEGPKVWDFYDGQLTLGLVPFDLHIRDLDFIVYTFGRPEKVICNVQSVRNRTASVRFMNSRNFISERNRHGMREHFRSPPGIVFSLNRRSWCMNMENA